MAALTSPGDDSPARTVLVTGGGRGIGAGITRELVARGRLVACGYRDSREATEKLRAETPEQVLPVHYDLGDHASANSAVREVLARWGRLDALILNAGTWTGGRLSTLDPLAWWRIIELNLGGAAALVRAALPAMRGSDDPSIVVVSSVIGLIGHAGDTAYASAKAALIGFARSLAKETGRDRFRVNVLAPGFVDTDMTAQVPGRARDGIAQSTVLGRFGTVPEIARAAVFLSEDATYCTGSVLTADGGWSL
ncbi:SDR family oxidoreductase [Saccharomonospora sp. NPDC046836]|uniref:SDR family NAD(P)-dependent oxidoreductase n=1 Tax=Saccharomonospora sp. NPDC046836 TaxID=3156921 RepID=UPI0033D03679